MDYVVTRASFDENTALRAVGHGLFHLIRYLCIGIKQYCLLISLIHGKDLWTDLHTGTTAITRIGIDDDLFFHPASRSFQGIFLEIFIRFHRIDAIKTGQTEIIRREPGCLNQPFQTEIMERIETKVGGRLLY